MFIDVLKTVYAMTARTFGLKHGGNIMQQDNDPIHTSKKSKAFYKRYNVNVMAWPSCSPDLNPIEHVWDYVDRHVRSRDVQPQTLEELELAIGEEWYAVPDKYIQDLYEGYERRLMAIVIARGRYNKY
ncbi:hypothetical protein ENBRE01_2288 [Enteropsectra breve]|nr:hypothetical protein ENBRE01_2288 [Enteropsectra breve]